MEVKVFYKDKGKGKEAAIAIESFRIPDYVGRTTTATTGEGPGIDVTEADVDLVASVVERLLVSSRGAFLSRRLIFSDRACKMAGTRPSGGEQSVLIVRPERMSDVERIALDGEVVWPEDAAEAFSDALGRIEELAGGVA